MSAFGVIVAGRMVQTEFVALNESQFVIELPDSENINHIAVFLTGLHPLPPEIGGSIYISWPNSSGEFAAEPNWHFLSFISNQKPSAFFKIGQLKRSNALNSQGQSPFNNFIVAQSPNFAAPSSSQNATLGIILEPLNQIQQKTEAEKANPSAQPSAAQFADKMLSNFVNYVQSFAISLPKPSGPIGCQMEEFVPAKAVTDWFNNFRRKLQLDPNFWRNLP